MYKIRVKPYKSCHKIRVKPESRNKFTYKNVTNQKKLDNRDAMKAL